MKKLFFNLLPIVIIGAAIYSNTLNAPFLWDDSLLIVENSNIRNLSNFTDCSGTRYLTFLSFAINYKLNGLNVIGYHIFNIAVHLLNAILIYLLITVIFRTPYFIPPFNSPLARGGVVGGAPLSNWGDRGVAPLPNGGQKGVTSITKWGTVGGVGYRGVALFSGLIFVSHPVYTMAVTNINQRSILVATFFYLLSLVTYINWRLRDNSLIPPKADKNRSGVSPDSQDVEFHLRPQAGSLTYNKGNTPSMKIGQASRLTKRYALYAISVISAVFAMKCKEVSITLPVTILLIDRFFFRDKWKKTFIFTIPFLLTLLIIPFSKPQPDVFNRPSTPFQIKDESILSGLEAKQLSDIPRKDYILTEFRVILTYLRLFFLPFNLNFAYDYPTYKSFLEPSVILSFLIVILLFALAIYLFYRSKFLTLNPQPLTSNFQLVSFGIFWFFITLSIESFVVVLNYVIFEYRLYLPSIGILLLFAGLLGHASSHVRDKSLYIFKASITVVVIFLVATYVRNEVLKDEIALWKDVAKKSPLKVDGYNNVGNAYYAKGLLGEAIQEYKTALILQPDSEIIHFNLGSAYLSKGQLNEAVQEFKIASKINPDFAGAHYRLGNTYYIQKRTEAAVKEYQIAINLNPDFAEAHANLGAAYEEQGNLDEAVKEYNAAIYIKPDFAAARYNLGSLYVKLGHPDKALKEYQTVIRLKPDFAEVYNNLGAVYSNQSRIDEAIKAYKTALRLKPDYAPARKNLEMLYKKSLKKN